MRIPKARREEWWVWSLAAVLVIASLCGLWATFLASTFEDRDRTKAILADRAQSNAETFALNVGNVLGTSRLALYLLAQELALSPAQDAHDRQEFRALVGVIRSYSQQGLDVRGVTREGTLRELGDPMESDSAPTSVGDRDFFRKQLPYPGLGLFIDTPRRDAKTGQWALDLSLAAPPTQGPLTVLTVALRFSRLDEMVKALSPGSGDSVALYRDDGALLYQYPPSGRFPVSKDSPVAAIRASGRSSGLLPGPDLAAFYRVEKAPLWVIASRSSVSMLNHWRGRFFLQLALVGLLSLGLLASTAGLVYFLTRLRSLRLAQEALARTDPLTGLLNRRAFLERCEQEQLRLARHPGPLSLALLDLDHFKRINDRSGHQAGDQALREFAAGLGRTLRASDVVARIGGEEFAVLMPESDQAVAVAIGERIRAEAAVELPNGKLTTSVGVAEWDGRESFESWFARADRALYRAKAAGRNRVEAAEPQ